MIGMATDDKAAPPEIFSSLTTLTDELEDLVALLKSRGVAFGPGEPAQSIVYGELALLRHAKGTLESEVERLSQQLESANQQISVHAERLGAAKAEIKHDKEVLAMLRGDNAALVVSRNRYAEQFETEQRARADERKGFEAAIRALQHSAIAAASTIEDQQAENRMKQAQILNQRDAILVLEGSLRDLQRQLNARPSATVGEALAYVATEASWAATRPGARGDLQSAYQRACEAFMWFQRATQKEEP